MNFSYWVLTRFFKKILLASFIRPPRAPWGPLDSGLDPDLGPDPDPDAGPDPETFLLFF